jgi:hypothetical protein
MCVATAPNELTTSTTAAYIFARLIAEILNNSFGPVQYDKIPSYRDVCVELETSLEKWTMEKTAHYRRFESVPA